VAASAWTQYVESHELNARMRGFINDHNVKVISAGYQYYWTIR
jgi:hypothetical protein